MSEKKDKKDEDYPDPYKRKVKAVTNPNRPKSRPDWYEEIA